MIDRPDECISVMLRISPEQDREIDEMAQRRHTTRSSIVRAAITGYLKRHRKLQEKKRAKNDTRRP